MAQPSLMVWLDRQRSEIESKIEEVSIERRKPSQSDDLHDWMRTMGLRFIAASRGQRS